MVPGRIQVLLSGSFSRNAQVYSKLRIMMHQYYDQDIKSCCFLNSMILVHQEFIQLPNRSKNEEGFLKYHVP